MASNRYCERIGLASVPRVEAVLEQDLDKNDANLFRLMVVALLEHGRPMTVEEIAERLSRAGGSHGAATWCWHSKERGTDANRSVEIQTAAWA